MAEAPMEMVESIDSNPLSSYQYMKMKIRTSPDGEDISVGTDSGTGRSFVDREFLKTTTHSIEKRDGTVKGILPGVGDMNEWATYEFWKPGHDDQGNPTLKFIKGGWVVDNLDAVVLLGNDWLDPYGASIDYPAQKIHLTKVGLSFPVTITPRGKPCVRKVKTTRKVTLLPGQRAYIPVTYKPLPNDRSLAFHSKHDAVINAVVDARTPQVVLCQNVTKGVITLSL
ncbi:hypothetical protein QBC34DRAFT_419537 [Podospora aff. communis PSN243]|uniref:Uncharacterized protein n=1 Tax=Podospora aff. communis PSN243 TaxID=3040156 RepID=A0AAV9FYI3_9PEZI|nr:hypothetical protein QBC34DRAFT_419537 [Podospora aff. communis PSN243]